MPPGLVNSAERDPRNFTRVEWQQAKRAEHDPATLKGIFQDCWAISDSRKAFAQALAARGLYLARGDRRGFVAVDIKGEVFAIARWTGLKTKVVEARLGNPDELPGVAETKAKITDLLKGVLGRHLAEVEADHRARRSPVQARQAKLREVQRERRAELLTIQALRATLEAQARAARFRRGWRGLWDRVIGRHGQVRRENEAEAIAATHRDASEREAMIQGQLQERRPIKAEMNALRRAFEAELTEVYREIAEIDQPVGETRLDETDDRMNGPRRRNRRGPEP